MRCPFCSLDMEALANSQASGHSLEGACTECRARARVALLAPHALKQAVPRESASTRARNVAAAIDRASRGAPRVAARARRPPAWLALPATAVVAAAAALAFVVARPNGASTPVTAGPALVAGEVTAADASIALGAAIPSETEMVVTSPAAMLRLGDGTEIEVSRASALAWKPRDVRIVLVRGAIALSVRPRPQRPLSVMTDEAVVTVVGTKFRVSRELGTGTHVSVQEGTVEVRRGADTVRLSANDGELHAEPSAPMPIADAGPASSIAIAPEADADAAVHADSLDAASPSRAALHPVKAAAIRDRLRRGHVREARELYQRAKSQAGSGSPELRIVEAELLLAEGRHAAAIDVYLLVARSSPSTSQGEEGLFAAAQLLVDHGGRERGRVLLREYRGKYPRGRFRSEVERLLDATGGP